VGDGLSKDSKIGPIISEPQYKKVLNYIDSGVKEGAKLVFGGKKPKISEETPEGGYFVEPTIFTDVKEDMKIWKEEIFGPVLSIMTFDTEEQAIQISNNTEYGLAAAVMSQDEKKIK